MQGVFIGPCSAKKLEASRRTVRSDVDFVITFEELTGMFEAKGILLDEIKAMDEMKDATAAGRGYGVAGGVANAIKDCIEKYYPGTPVNIQHAESLAECKKALLLAKAGKMKWVPDRGYGLSRRMHRRSRHQHCYPCSGQSRGQVQERGREEST